MFCDTTQVKLGEVTVNVRRLTLAEIKKARVSFQSGADAIDDSYEKLLHEHVTLEDGTKLDPS